MLNGKLVRVKSSLMFALFLISVITIIPAGSCALVAGNYFTNVRAVNGETVLETPDNENYTSRQARVSVQYDGEDHGFSYSCRSYTLYSGKTVHPLDGFSCTAVNEAGEEVPCRLVNTADQMAVYLVSPD